MTGGGDRRPATGHLLAMALLAALAADATPVRTAQPNRPARSPGPIDLTVPEVRHPLGVLPSPPNTSPHRLLQWSNRRRSHQATARRSHYRRRLAAPATGRITKSHWSISRCGFLCR
ncbi:hypothetical protein [Streptomyces sp. NPDC017890]|uniref:hypothetical protein n=1 Tax=Streptomyces sp. NPDC017890 TaxID=3365015 RepID=UPI00379C91E0